MSIIIQLKSFAIFFSYGLVLYLINYLCNIKKNKAWLVSIIFPSLTGIFMFFLYKQNNGIVHIYFIAIMILGIILSKVTVKKVIYFYKLLIHKHTK